MTEEDQGGYPERDFVLGYREEQVSFYQRGGGTPEHDEPPTESLPEILYCETCQERKAYRLRMQSDREFPKADWGECANCGAELLLRTWKIRIIV